VSVHRTVSEIFSVKEWRDLETGGRGHSRSSEMAPFDRPYTIFYWSAIVYLVPFLSYLTLNRDLEIWVRSCSRTLKMAPFDRPLYDFLSVRQCKYSSIWYHFWVIWRWKIS